MSEPTCLLVAGNGLSMDLGSTFTRLGRDWNTQRPLGWDVHPPRSRARHLLSALPLAASEISRARESIPDANDFEIFERILVDLKPHIDAIRPNVHRRSKVGSEEQERGFLAMEAVHQLRLYLGLAFGAYHFEAERYLSTSSWRWWRFFERHHHVLVGVVSFNYDLNLETMLAGLGRPVSHVGIARETFERSGLAIFKPHGSVDYKADRSAVAWNPHPFPPNLSIELSDMPFERIHRSDLRGSRVPSDLVLPSEASQYRTFRRSRTGRAWTRGVGSRSATILIVGLSYWSVDRPEIDEILAAVPRSARAIVADPHPNADLMRELQRKFSAVEVWADGPRSI